MNQRRIFSVANWRLILQRIEDKRTALRIAAPLAIADHHPQKSLKIIFNDQQDALVMRAAKDLGLQEKIDIHSIAKRAMK